MEISALDAGFAPVERAKRRDLSPLTAAVAGGVLLLAWAVGAVVAPAAPSPLSARLEVHEYFVANHDAALNQSLLVHGIAGVALAVLVVALWRGGVHRRLFLFAGLAAAAASFVELFFVFRIEHHIEKGIGVRRTDLLFDSLNRTCAVKFALLAVAVGSASWVAARSRAWPAWASWIGYALVPLLALAAVTAVANVPAQRAVLSLWPPMLMLWVTSTVVGLVRRPPTVPGP
jgi:hypothetical protein